MESVPIQRIQILYIEDLVHEELLEEVKNRLEEYKIDGILDSGMLEQLTEKPWYSPFPAVSGDGTPGSDGTGTSQWKNRTSV